MDSKDELKTGKSVKNQGTGAGGSNTNKNGLPYEQLTDLNDMLTVRSSKTFYNKITFNSYPANIFIETKKAKVFKYMDSINEINNHIEKARL